MVKQQVRDDKNVVTDIAFTLDERLLGTRLAKPFERGIAMLVDAFLVLLLTDVSPMFWALFASIAFFKAGKDVGNKSWRLTRWILRWGGALAIFIATLSIVGSLISDFTPSSVSPKVANRTGDIIVSNDKPLQAISSGVKLATLMSELEQKDPDKCDLTCFDKVSEDIIEEGRYLTMEDSELIDMLTESYPEQFFTSSSAKVNHIGKLVAGNQDFDNDVAVLKTDETEPNTPDSNALVNALKKENSNLKKRLEQASEQDNSQYSLVEFVKTQIEDLGLGFGWAALYFTAFAAWWRGQTPGKKLMGIRVIQLDGTYMSAWDSFERYGGYGAGFATGLLGFIQIYWDPNRQAIQDKICATVVIKGDLPDSIPEKTVYKEQQEPTNTET